MNRAGPSLGEEEGVRKAAVHSPQGPENGSSGLHLNVTMYLVPSQKAEAAS